METPFRNALCEPVLQVLGVLLPVTARLSEMKVSKHFFCPCYPPKSSSLHLVLPHCLRAAVLPLVGSEPSPGRSDPFTARTAFPPSERWKPDSSIPRAGFGGWQSVRARRSSDSTTCWAAAHTDPGTAADGTPALSEGFPAAFQSGMMVGAGHLRFCSTVG